MPVLLGYHQGRRVATGFTELSCPQPQDGRSRSASVGEGRPEGAGLDSSRIEFHPSAELRRERYSRQRQSARFLWSEGVSQLGYERLDMRHLVDTKTGELVDVDLNREGDRWARPVRPVRCGWSIGETVSLHHAEGGQAHWGGLERCGSIWACPVCAAVIRNERAAEIRKAVEFINGVGGSMLFFTGTLRHHMGESLDTTLDTILRAWQKTISGKAWKKAKERLGIVGYIRAVEVTVGANGWHPHAHVMLMLENEISSGEFEWFRSWLFDRWADRVEALGCSRPTAQGLDLQRVDDDGEVLAKYLGKVQDEGHHWGADAELARGDVKRGRAEGSMTPFELLDEPRDEYGLVDERELGRRASLWREFYRATKGRRAITWSRGLKALCDIEERTDEEIIEETESAPSVWVTSADEYRRVRSEYPEVLPLLLEAVERGDMDAVGEWLPPMRL